MRSFRKILMIASIIVLAFILSTIPLFAATNYDGGVGSGGAGSSTPATGTYSVGEPWASETC